MKSGPTSPLPNTPNCQTVAIPPQHPPEWDWPVDGIDVKTGPGKNRARPSSWFHLLCYRLVTDAIFGVSPQSTAIAETSVPAQRGSTAQVRDRPARHAERRLAAPTHRSPRLGLRLFAATIVLRQGLMLGGGKSPDYLFHWPFRSRFDLVVDSLAC